MEKKVLKNTEIISMALWFKKEKILVIGDLHLGQEEEYNKKGVFVPRNNFSKTLGELDFVLKKTGQLKKIVLLGDIKHEFGTINNQEWVEVIKIIDFLETKCEKLIIIKGNHDKYINSIAKWKNFKAIEKFEENNYCFCHGDKIIETKKKIIIIGHEHSAIILSDEYKREKFKCIAKTKYKKKEVIVLPSFGFINIGTDLLNEDLISPYLKKSKNFEIWVIEEKKNFYFGEMNKKFK